MSKVLSAAAAIALFAAGSARAVTVEHVGYSTGAQADKSQFAQVFEAEDLYQQGSFTGSVVWPLSVWPDLVWFMTAGDSMWATFIIPTDEIVVQIPNSDVNDGLALTYLDGELVDTVDLNSRVADAYKQSGGWPVAPAFYIRLTDIPPGLHTVKVVSVAAPGCSYWDCDDLHLDFVAGRLVSIPVAIDIKPGSDVNSINLGSSTVPVAILGSATLSVDRIDPTTVTLASAPIALLGRGAPMASYEDVNGDGFIDLVVHVETDALQLAPDGVAATLTGQLVDGKPFQGSDMVRVVP